MLNRRRWRRLRVTTRRFLSHLWAWLSEAWNDFGSEDCFSSFGSWEQGELCFCYVVAQFVFAVIVFLKFGMWSAGKGALICRGKGKVPRGVRRKTVTEIQSASGLRGERSCSTRPLWTAPRRRPEEDPAVCFLKKSIVSQVTTRDLSTSDGLRRGTSSPTPKAET